MEIIKPDSQCTLCHGSGYMIEEGNKRVSCTCLIRQRALEYLGPMYKNCAYNSKTQFDLWGDFVRIETCSRGYFKSMIKSLLLRSDISMKHKSTTPPEIMDVYFENRENNFYKDLNLIDFLIIYFCNDPTNRMYSEVIISILDKRVLYNRKTWVYCQDSSDSTEFIKKYGKSLSDFLGENFTLAGGTHNLIFDKGLKV